MDVRSIEDVEPVVEHNGTVPVWWLFKSREMKEITDGGFLELVNEFEVAGGGYVDPHSHPTHEFYYVTVGARHHDHRGRGPRHRPGRPGAHPARQGPQPPPGERPRPHPLLLLRHRRQGLRADRLHQPLIAGPWRRVLVHPRRSPTGGLDPLLDEGHDVVQRADDTPYTHAELVELAADRRRRGVPAHRPHRRTGPASRGRRGTCGWWPTWPWATTTSTSAAASRLGVAVCNTPGVLDETTADVAFLLVLAASRLASEAERDLRRGAWAGWGINQYLGHDVHGATLGLVGYGRIGRAVARRASGFGMQVLHHTRHPTGMPGYVADARRPPGRVRHPEHPRAARATPPAISSARASWPCCAPTPWW